MFASTATASATSAIQASSPLDKSSMLMADISSSTDLTRAEVAAPARTASAAAAGTYTVRVRPAALGRTTYV
jgi:hypothetical protein